MQLIDSHCHIHFEAYKEDMDEAVKRSLDAGVQMVTIGTQSTTSKNAIALAEKYDGVYATIGLHPNHLHRQEFFDEQELPPEERATGKIKTRSELFDPAYYEKLVHHPKVVAIGEFGLDYYRIPNHLDRASVIANQRESCKQQLEFANRFNKPVVIHCRDAHEMQYELLKELVDAGRLQNRGVIHSFTGTAVDAERYRELGFRIGLNGILTFSKDLQEQVKHIPLEQIMLETDAPYLTPPPHRGKRNEPQYVRFIAQMVADIHGINVEEVAARTTHTSKTLFQLDG